MQDNQCDTGIKTGKLFLENYKGKGHHTNAYKVLRRIFEFACSAETEKTDDGSVIFTWRDIQTADDEADDGKRLKRHINLAIEKWSTHYDALNQIAADEELNYYPLIELTETGGGSGNLTKYKIKLVPVSEASAVDKGILQKGYIAYTAEVIDSSNRLIKFVDGLTAKGINFFILVGTMAIVLTAGVFALWAGLYLLHQQTTTFGLLKTVLNTSLFIGALYLFFSPLYFCLTRRIIIAPFLLSCDEHYSTQIEYIPTGELDKKGKKIRQFRVVSYVSECPVCGGRVDVEKGRGTMSGRLVGRCSESPTEHVYTFDPQTKVGKLIHLEYMDIKTP